MENKNTIVALSLMMLLWIGYTFLFPTPQVTPVSPSTPPAAVAIATEQPKTAAVMATPVATPIPTAQRKEIIVETDLYRAVLTTQGARLKDFYLKNYKTKADESSAPVNLVTSSSQGGTFALSGEGDFSVSDQAMKKV